MINKVLRLLFRFETHSLAPITWPSCSGDIVEPAPPIEWRYVWAHIFAMPMNFLTIRKMFLDY